MNYRLPFWAGMLLLLVGCTKSSQLNPTAPDGEVAAPAAFTPRLSTITVPVSFRISALQEKLNQQITGTLYKDDNLNDDNLKVTVVKAGNLGLQANGDKIYLTMPLRVAATGRWLWEACKICPRLEKTESTTFDLVIKSESQLALTEDYQVKSQSISDFSWGDTKPVISLGPLTIGISRFIEPALRNQMQMLAGQLDREIQSRIKIKDYVQQAWLQVQQPIPLDKTLGAWLTVTPQAIRVSAPSAQNGELTLQIGFSSYLQTVTNGKPTVKLNPTLPPLLTANNLTNEVQIGLVSEISYSHATQLLKSEFVGKEFKFSGGKDRLTVHDLALSGSGKKLVIMLDVTGSTQKTFFTKTLAGKIFLKAEPFYDAATQSIRVRDLDYDLDTKDRLLSTASWLAKNRFIHALEEQITVPLKDQLTETRNLLQQNLNQAASQNQAVRLQGNITEITPDVIHLTPTAIKAMVNAKGNLTAQVLL